MATQGNNDNVEKLQVILHHQRQRLYPTLYNANSNVPQILNHFAVDYFLYDPRPDVPQPLDEQRIERAVEAAASKKLKHHHQHHQPDSEIDVEESVTNPTKKNTTVVANTICSSTNVPDIASNQPEKEITIVPLDMIRISRVVGHNDTTDVSLSEKQTLPAATLSSSSSRDIWGRVPPKEYIPTAAASNNHNTTSSGMGGSSSSSSETVVVATCMMICSICQQKVGSSLRYASHLDKCLGIGTMSRNTNSSTSSTLHNSSNTSSYLHS